MSEKPLTISLPKETHEALKRASKAKGTSKRWEARQLVIAGATTQNKK